MLMPFWAAVAATLVLAAAFLGLVACLFGILEDWVELGSISAIILLLIVLAAMLFAAGTGFTMWRYYVH